MGKMNLFQKGGLFDDIYDDPEEYADRISKVEKKSRKLTIPLMVDFCMDKSTTASLTQEEKIELLTEYKTLH